MIHSELGYKLLKAECTCLEKHIIWSLNRWRIYGDHGDFRSAMISLHDLAALKSLNSMRDELVQY
jgi:hypothetical protein